jgi:hypothetical protein
MKALLRSLCVAFMLVGSTAWADMSRDDAAAAAQRASGGGRVLSVERAGPAWRVKVVTAKGEVRVIVVDAASGRTM